MNLTTCMLSFFILTALLRPNPTPIQQNPGLAEGLIAHYSFNDCQALDLTDGGSDGRPYGDPGCHCGVEGNALFFDGLNDHLEFPGKVNRCFGTTDFTVSFYLKPSGYSVFRQSLLGKREQCDDYTHFDLQLDVNRHEIQTDVYESPEKHFTDLTPETPDTDWIHYALVREGIWAYTYINGQLRKEDSRCSGVDIDNGALLSFANSPCLGSGRAVRFKGGLDELRVYDRALSNEEIAELYALHPVELAEADCVTFVPETPMRSDGINYLCWETEIESLGD